MPALQLHFRCPECGKTMPYEEAAYGHDCEED